MKAKLQAVLPFAEPLPPTSDQLHAKGRTHFRNDFLPKVRAAIDRLTAKECAVLFDSSPSGIGDALDHRDRKRPAMEWLIQLLLSAPDATKLELLTELCKVAGYKAPAKARVMTAEEELTARIRAERRLAPAIAEMIDREIEEST